MSFGTVPAKSRSELDDHDGFSYSVVGGEVRLLCTKPAPSEYREQERYEKSLTIDVSDGGKQAWASGG